MAQAKTKIRPYRRITQRELARYKAEVIAHGNGTAAVRAIDRILRGPSYLNAGDRAWRLQKKSEDVTAIDFIDQQLEQIGIDSINRVGIMVNSKNEAIATKNSHFIIDHLKGKATQKSISLTGKLNIQNVLD